MMLQAKSKRTQTIYLTNQTLEQIHVADVKHGKTCESESPLVLPLTLLLRSCLNFLNFTDKIHQDLVSLHFPLGLAKI